MFEKYDSLEEYVLSVNVGLMGGKFELCKRKCQSIRQVEFGALWGSIETIIEMEIYNVVVTKL
jgi:hypothetical protein